MKTNETWDSVLGWCDWQVAYEAAKKRASEHAKRLEAEVKAARKRLAASKDPFKDIERITDRWYEFRAMCSKAEAMHADMTARVKAQQ